MTRRMVIMRTLYLISYDVGHPRRLRQDFRYLQGYRVHGQKSVFECWITQGEKRQIVSTLHTLAELEEDRIHIFHLDPRTQVLSLGLAIASRPVVLYYAIKCADGM